MIEVSGLSKFYGDYKAIDDVSFKITEGSIVGLLGLNGAGKSTILKMLASYLAPTKGTIQVADFNYDDRLSELRKAIGYLPDRPPIYEEMRVTDFLYYAAKLRGIAASEAGPLVEDALNKTNLLSERSTHLGQLSHGFRQRVGIAQAIVHRPRLLILDEPINGLDPIQIVEMRDLILSFKKIYTVILSSHILSEITKTCDQILILDKGKLVAEGSEAELESHMTGMSVQIDWRNSAEAIFSKLKGLPGVLSAELSVSDGIAHATMKLESDLRGQLAKAVLENSGELLTLRQLDSGLEGLFMKLVK